MHGPGSAVKRGAWALLLALGASAIARAEETSPPKEMACFPGAYSSTSRFGTYCAPTKCKEDADCDDPRTFDGQRPKGELRCAEEPLCIREEKASWLGHNGTRLVVLAECDGDSCPATGTCKRARRCVPKDLARPRGRLGACGCELPEGGSGAPGAAVALGLTAAIVAARRASRRRTRPPTT